MRAKLAITIFVILALLLNLGGVAKSTVVSIVKQGALSALYPLQYLSSSVVLGISGFADFIKTSYTNNQINQNLAAENALLKMKLLEIPALQRENEILRGHRYSIPDYFRKIICAKIAGRASDLWNSYLIIDSGQAQGVEENLSVIVPDGLVGKVVSADKYTSKVLLLLDVKSSVMVRSQKSRIEALAVGRGDRTLNLKYVPAGSEIYIGEKVNVSSSSSLLPGILVGYISKISAAETSLFKNIEVTPAVDFSKLEFLYVVVR